MEKWIFIVLLHLLSSLFQISGGFILCMDSTNSKDRCPDSVAHGKYLHTFREKCYEFVIYQEKYWKDAREDCMRKAGDLVVVNDAALQTFLITTLNTMGNTKDGLWIGLTDSRHELHWEWVNGEPLQGYNNWAHLQGGANFLHLTQDCAQIRMNDNGLWHDRECHLWPNKFSYICEYEMSKLLTQKTSTVSTSTTSKSSHPPTKDFGYETTATKFPTSTLISDLLRTSAFISTSSKSLTTSSQSPTSTSNMMANITTVVASNTAFASSENINTSSEKVATSETEGKILELSSKPATDKDKYASDFPSISSSPLVSFTITTEKTVICSELNCAQSCPNGYSGVYVGLDGCINCRCN